MIFYQNYHLEIGLQLPETDFQISLQFLAQEVHNSPLSILREQLLQKVQGFIDICFTGCGSKNRCLVF